jgi:hypothetical protein
MVQYINTDHFNVYDIARKKNLDFQGSFHISTWVIVCYKLYNSALPTWNASTHGYWQIPYVGAQRWELCSIFTRNMGFKYDTREFIYAWCLFTRQFLHTLPKCLSNYMFGSVCKECDEWTNIKYLKITHRDAALQNWVYTYLLQRLKSHFCYEPGKRWKRILKQCLCMEGRSYLSR